MLVSSSAFGVPRVRFGARSILVHAHRGGRAFRPENTLPAFQYGIAAGADVLELDLAVTKDDVLVVSHSPFLTLPETADPQLQALIAKERHCAGPALPPGTPIRSLTVAEVKRYDCGSTAAPGFPHQMTIPQTPIPTFDEVLALASQGAFDFNVETKSFPSHPDLTPPPEVFAAMIDDAVRRRDLEARVILQSFDFRTLDAMRARNAAIRLSALFEDSRHDALLGLTDHDKSFGHIAEVTGAEILSPDQTLVTPEAVAEAHRLGRQVVPFTVNKPDDWDRMANAGVDAMITDDPAGLLAWLRAQRPPLHS